ncbi:MAG: ATP-binding cassette domain-containing protein, partial [Candidatus Poribacteria bacterium]|nr:ATP-binding cassette domain-containing protein [Candidatus Poribacteria bacterium]
MLHCGKHQSDFRAATGKILHHPLLEISGLRTVFDTDDGPVRAVDDVSFTIEGGRTLGVVGESGCGKSTTGRGILKLIKSNNGSIKYENDEISHLYENDLRKLRKNFQ